MNNNRTRRILSLLLIILMVLSAFAPLTVYAAEEEEAVTESEEMAEEPTIERAVPHPSFTPLCYYDYSQFPVVMHLNAGTPGRSLLKARSLDGKTGTLSLSGYYEYFGGTDTYGDPMALGAIFLISVDGVTYEGVCGQSYMPTPPSGEYTVVEVSGYTADEIKLALMAGIGDLSWYGSDVYGDLLNESSVGWTHGLVSYLNTGSMASYPYNEVVYDNWEIEALDQAVANIDWLLDNDSYMQDVINRTHLYQTVGGANQDIMFVVTDDHIPSTDIDVNKVNPNADPLSGAVFTIYSDAGYTNEIGSMTSDEDGYAAAHFDEDYDVLYVIETEFPTGYSFEDGVHPEFVVEITDGWGHVNGGDPVVNTPNTKIRIHKINTENEGLAGAVFDIYDGEGGTLLGSMTTDSDGNADSEEFDRYYATVYVVETSFPSGYTSGDGEQMAWTVDVDPVTGEGYLEAVNYQETDIDVLKTDPSGRGLPGAEFEVYDEKDGTLLGTMVTGIGGNASLHIEQYLASVFIRETKFPEGMTSEDGNQPEWTIPVVNGVGSLEAVNYPEGVIVTVLKLNENEEGLPGAEFEVYDEKGGTLLGTMVTDEDGNASMELDDNYASVYVIETVFPDNYTSREGDETEWVVSILQGVGSITVYNYHETDIDVYKTDPSGRGLPGAEFEVYDEKNGSLLGTMTTGNGGSASLHIDQYLMSVYIVETVCPPGMTTEDGEDSWTIPVVNGVGGLEVVNYPETDIDIYKTDPSGNGLPGAEFTVYDYEGGILLGTMVTDENGEASMHIDAYYTSVYIVETEFPDGYGAYDPDEEDPSWTLEIPADTGKATLYVTNYQTSVDVIKENPAGDRLAGALFGIYTSDVYTKESRIGEMITDENGTASFTTPGHYSELYVKEEEPAAGCELPEVNTWTVEITDGVGHVNYGNPVINTPTSLLYARKVSGNPVLTDGNRSYDFSGIQFKVYMDAACTTEALDTNGHVILLESNSAGSTGGVSVSSGVYYVSEVEKSLTGKGWKYNPNPTMIEVPEDGTDEALVAEISNEPLNDPMGIQITKITSDPDYADADLSGAQYTIKFYEGQYTNADLPGSANATWVVETKKHGKNYRAALNDEHVIMGEAVYGKDNAGNYKLPLGTVTIEETKAPEGFTLVGSTICLAGGDGSDAEDGKVLYNFVDDQGVCSVVGGNQVYNAEGGVDFESSEEKARGDLAFTKTLVKTDGTEIPFAGIPFIIKSVDTGETHYIVTDANGNFSSAAVENKGHTKNTNGYDEILSGAAGNDGIIPASMIEGLPDAGIWFGDGPADDAKGALPTGKYEVTELKTEANKDLDMVATIFEVTEEGVVTEGDPIVNEEVPSSTLSAKKLSANTGITDGNENYDFSGIQFKVYTDEVCTIEATDKSSAAILLTTDASGETESVFMETGVYYVREVEESLAGKGWVYNPNPVKIIVPERGQAEALVAEITNSPMFTAQIDITKVDESGAVSAGSDLSDAEYTVRYYAGQYTEGTLPSSSDAEWVIRTIKEGSGYIASLDSKHLVSGEAVYGETEDGDIVIPLGTITIEETKAPAGFVLEGSTIRLAGGDGSDESEGVVLYNFVENQGSVSVKSGNQVLSAKDGTAIISSEMFARGELSFTKKILGSERPMAGIPFKLTNLKTGETHYVVTGADGSFSSAAVAHSENTNGNDAVLAPYVAEGAVIPASVIESLASSGLWFGDAEVDDDIGSMPIGSYEITELRTESNQHMVMVTKTFTVTEGPAVTDGGVVYNVDVKIHTMALDADSMTHYALAEEQNVIIDTVYYENAVVGETYVLTATAMLTESGEVLEGFEGTKTFTTEAGTGSVEVRIVFDASDLAGKTITIYEEMTTADGSFVADHKELLDAEQMIHYPDIKTNAKDADTNVGLANADAEITITDTVSYTNLNTDKRYTLSGILVDKATGYPVLDDSGNPVTASKEFRPESPDGDVELTFTFKGASLAGTTAVVFEELKNAGKTFAVHADIEDEAQTVYIPDIHTTAVNKNTGIKTNEMGETTLVDTVSYTDLLPYKTYTLKAKVYDKTTGELTFFTGEKTFTPSGSSGTVDVEINLNTLGLEGHDLVAYEEAYYSEVLIADHSEPEDEDQTTEVAKIGTVAKDSQTDMQLAALGETTFIDTVSYENLVAGEEYTMKASLYDKTAGSLTAYTGETTFTAAEGGSGIVDVEIVLDTAGFAGHDLVCYENAYYKEVLVESHENPDDEGQTIHVAEIGTEAVNKETNIKTNALGETVIVDTVEYKNLIPGKTYTLKASIYDKTSGELTGFVGEKEFTPESANGSVDVEITVNTLGFEGHDLVAFEEAYYGEVLIADHSKPDDEDQTTEVAKIGTVAKDEQTEIQLAALGETTFIDTVSYENLVAGETYVMKASVYDKTKGALTSFTGEQEFVAVEGGKGTVEVEIKIDTTDFAGHDLVCYENAYYKEVLVESHENPDDEGQTIHVAEIGTEAVNKETNIKTNALGKTVIVDTVEYKNLIPGKTYTLKASIYDTTSGELTDFTGEKEFTPEKKDGFVDVEITVDTKGLEGHDLVAYEKAYYGEILIADHSEPEDETQTTEVAKIGTVAKDEQTEMQLAALGKTTFIDTVSYENFVAGEEYTMKASLYDKTAGSLTAYTDETTFTAAEGGSGTVDVEITLDTTGFAGHDLVCYENAYYKEVLVESHENPDDEGQTIHVAEIGTKARGKETNIKTNALGKTVIVDTVEYKNLIPGKTYTLKASIYDKTSGKLTSFTGEQEFTPEAKDGSVDVEITVNTLGFEGHDLVAFEEAYYGEVLIADHSKPDDEDQTTEVAKIGTVAKDAQTEIQLAAHGEATFIDTVSYENLVAGETYVMKASVYDKTKGALTSFTGEQEFVAAEGGKGTVDVKITVDTTGLAGHDLVCYENAYYKEVLVESHENPDDEGQTIHVGEIGTKAVNKETGIKTNALGKTVIVDTVEYKNLIRGKTYTLKASVYDKTSGELTDFTGEKEFTPEKKDGSVDVEITVDTKSLEGHDLVAYEKAYYGEILIADHEKPDDEDQTTEVPKIGTTAIDKNTAIKTNALGETFIVDTVAFENLIPGTEYRLLAVIYDQKTGEATKYTVEKTFTPVKAEGTVDVEIKIDTKEFVGKNLVCFETMYYGDVKVAAHEDLEDDKQRTTVAEIGTQATDKQTGNKQTANGKTMIVDTVKYTGLEVGKTYRLEAVIYDKETKEVTEFKASVDFTPEKKDGEVTIEIPVDTTDLDGHALVVFEKAYYGETLIADHSEPDDEEQTVYVPEISTSAVDTTTGVKSLLMGETSVTDTVHYKNLIPGVTYRLVGKLYVKPENSEKPESTEAEKPDAEKAEQYTQAGETVEVTFTPEKAEGDIDLTIPVKTSDLVGKALVAFEVLYIGEIEVADHTDIDDEAQTVYLPQIKTTLTDKQTGNKTSVVGDTIFVDTVAFKGVAPKEEYLLTTEIYVKRSESSKLLVAKTTVFTPETSEGIVDVEVEVNTEGLEKETLVCFETLTVGDEKHVLAEHKDIDDVDQSVYVPEVSTAAYVSTPGGAKTAYESSSFTIVDRVFYENLVPGEDYTVNGILMDKDTGSALIIGGDTVTSSAGFTAEEANGYVDVTFTFNAMGVGTSTGKEIVVFEDLLANGELVKSHSDLNDQEQKIAIIKDHVDTSDPGKAFMFLKYFLLASGLATVLFVTRKRFLA